MALLAAWGCAETPPIDLSAPTTAETTTSTSPTSASPLRSVEDHAVSAGWQGAYGHLQRGRGCIAQDFDGDGLTDTFVSNPADESLILYNRTPPGGALQFLAGPPLADGPVWWGGAAADLDADGDVDLFVAGGGNEAREQNALLFNEPVAGELPRFVDLASSFHIDSAIRGANRWIAGRAASGQVVDFDNDARLDIFANANLPLDRELDPMFGYNWLWRQSGDDVLDFVDVARDVGLDSTDRTQNSVWLDWDGDLDQDLFEVVYLGPNHLWRNLLAETGSAAFEDATAELGLAGNDLSFPSAAFAAVADDFNLDGFDDVLVFVRGFEVAPSPYTDGHVLFLNVGGAGFVDVAPLTGLNESFEIWENDPFRDHTNGGVMGGQAADVNGDGIPDVFFGNGGPDGGTRNQFFLSNGAEWVDVEGIGPMWVPRYEDASEWMDFPVAPDPAFLGEYPPYPYRTHGTCIVDLDGDGFPEIAETNGGPSGQPDVVQEPNRLWKLAFEEEARWLQIELRGDGVHVPAFPVGTRVAVSVSRGQDQWTVTRVLRGGSGFAAQNGPLLFFGLASAEQIDDVRVSWADGTITTVELPVFGERRVVSYGP